MRYEFRCEGCKSAPEGAIAALFDVEIPISKAPPIGEVIECLCCGKMTAKRIVSSNVGMIIKGSALPEWQNGQTFRANVGGNDMRFQFIDHPETDPAYQRRLAEAAGRNHITGDAAKMPARYDPKFGRVVVDVASNVPDPLGAIERSKRAGKVEVTKKNVNRKYKVRGKKEI